MEIEVSLKSRLETWINTQLELYLGFMGIQQGDYVSLHEIKNKPQS